MARNWYDSFPGIDLDDSWPILDSFRTPEGGPETPTASHADLHQAVSRHAPYTTVQQNRGGIS